MRRLFPLLLSLACVANDPLTSEPATTPASNSPQLPAVAPPTRLPESTHAILHAWEDTRPGLPPLMVRDADSLRALDDLLGTAAGTWFDATGRVPGHPLEVRFYNDALVVARAGMIELTRGQPGYFVVWEGSQPRIRVASAEELDSFLERFGISVLVVS